MKITFIGAGAFGSALANIVEYNGHEKRFFDPYKYPEISLEQALNGAELVVFVAPSNTFLDIAPKLDSDVPLICASKGFLSLKIFEKFTNFSVLGGAAFADSIMESLKHEEVNEDKTIVLTASSELSERVFSTENIRIEYTDDEIGILLCGALKNVYAIGAGFFASKKADNQENDSVPLSYLENIIPEFCDILEANGAKKSTMKLSCGAPDLLLSCSFDSRNFRFGYDLKNSAHKIDFQNLNSPTIEGLSVIESLSSNMQKPFILPESAQIFRDIIKVVNTAKKQYKKEN